MNLLCLGWPRPLLALPRAPPLLRPSVRLGASVSALGNVSTSITGGVRAIDRGGFHVHYACVLISTGIANGVD
jgi:hypothetical protein